jgi:sulfite exporter TauE/SafE
MWLAKSIYEPLPAIVMIAGGLLALVGLSAEREVWQLLLLPAGLLMLIAGLVLILKRRAYRLSRSRRDFEGLS